MANDLQAIFPRGEEFGPFRFAELQEKGRREGFEHPMVTPTSEWVLFRQGMHACPGRFFASTVLKLLMAHSSRVASFFQALCGFCPIAECKGSFSKENGLLDKYLQSTSSSKPSDCNQMAAERRPGSWANTDDWSVFRHPSERYLLQDINIQIACNAWW
ncbi:hypothetical protein K435DRAFT_521350 [Dendrothele bispora CBS 962.96]|uniref:Cytochrome P450 n=1 Tax=Dendrothele bispora (strain CBS 962.96) TaxID=1314807 RepID=A0A4S8M9F4_DENBC|nr:hypothetical protein K435DRAFT_521350 [Dendrothele bispora CBS 962.96]